MTTQHTPGPWHVHARYPFWVDDAENTRVVDVEASRLSVEEAIANARLIAAAPELIDLLDRCAEQLAHCLGNELDVVVQSRAAIAKAKGE